MAWGEKEGKKSCEPDKELSTDVIMRRPSYNVAGAGAGEEATKAASVNVAPGEGMASLQSPPLSKTWKQTPIKSTVIIALTVAAVAVVLDMAGKTSVVNTVAGPVAGAAAGAGLYISRLLWEAEVRAEAAILRAAAIAAVAGGVAGTAAAEILQSLLGEQSQRVSAVVGAMAGAAIVTIVRPHIQLVIDTMQWVINTVKWLLAQVKRVIAVVKWCTKVTKLASLIATVIGVSKFAIAAVFKISQTAAAGVAGAGAAAAGTAVSGVAASGTAGAAAAAGTAGAAASGVAAAGTAGAGTAGAAASGVAAAGTAGAAASGVAAAGAAAAGAAAAGAAAATAGAAASGVAAAGVAAAGAAAAVGVAAAGATLGGLVAGSGTNGSQREGQSDTQAPVMTEEHPKKDKPPQPEPKMDGQTDEPTQMEESQKKDGYLQKDESPKKAECLQTEKPQQPDKSLETDETLQTEESPKKEEDLHVDKPLQTKENLQKDESPKTDEPSKSEESPKTDELLQTDKSPETDELLQTDKSPETDEILQTDKSPETDELLQTDKSPKTDEPPQTEESPKTDELLQTEESPKTDELLQTEESPKTDELLQTDGFPKTDESLISDSPENTEKCETENSLHEQFTEGFESNDSLKRENKDTGAAGVSSDEDLQQDMTKSEKIEHLFHRLNLQRDIKVRAADVLQITAHSLQSLEFCAEKELAQTFLQKLLMMNYRIRHINKANEHDKSQQSDNGTSEDIGDIFQAISLSNKGTNQSEQSHLMDVQMAVFYCADFFLKQLMVTKLSQCQYALPLLVPDPFTQQIEFPLWTFRQINKSWKMTNTNNEIISQTKPIYKAETPMVFFFRFGSVSSSKSQLMNSLINEKHNTFFHRNCPGSSRSRVLMDGVVEIAWFCPSGKNTDKFIECVAFCNLHGDAGDHEKQLQILTEMASVNVVLLPQLEKEDKSAKIIQNLYKNNKPLICLLTGDESTVIKMKKGKFKIGLKDRNQSDVSEELRRTIKDCLSETSFTFKLEDVSKHSDIRIDEEDDDDCRKGREAAQQMIGLLEEENLTKTKESFLPHQGKLWHQWSQKNKELHRPQGENIAKEISKKETEMKKIREDQHEFGISKFMTLFSKQMISHTKHKNMFFLKWLRILLDEHTSADLSALHLKYDKTWSAVLEMKENSNKSEQHKAKQSELERISEDLQAATFGLEHIMREIGQIYESCSSVKKNKKDLQVHFSSLPSLAAEMMISGSPLELMDGDAAHVPLLWISAVLDQLIQKLGDQRLFVLSVLGLQSSGKSTMLNAMFGLQFAVSAGRCTRGAFMQLVKVSDEMKPQMSFDYILVVDTEGLRALELAGRSTRHHDNELATFVVGLGNLTLINIFGENPSEMQDILQIVVQAFMRMKKVNLSPSCVFVHQNVTDVTAGEKNMEGRRRLQETLDEMTKLAAKDEVCDAECFSDVIGFDVQNDVKYFAQLWEGSPPMAPPNPNYCENIQELKETIISHAKKSHGMTLKELTVRIKDLWEALLNERFVFSFRNSLEISAYRKLETEYSKWSWSLRSAMMETENILHNQIENEKIHEVEETDLQREMKKTIEEVTKSMSDFFEKDTDAEILIQWKTSFEIKIKELQENIVRETKRKLTEVLQQRCLKKKIDAQRTNNENTFYKKSRELALNLKGKTNDEETLRNEFNSFWAQWMQNIIKHTPPIKDIDIMSDVREILIDTNKSVSVDHWKKSSEFNKVVTGHSYLDYIHLKKTSGFNRCKNVVTRVLGYGLLSKEDESEIKSLVTDVVQQTDKDIQSFEITKMGYNKSCIQKLTSYVKAKITKHEEEKVRYVFKNEFFLDLVLSICEKAEKKITDQHRKFREANDPVIYVEKKREEYYSIFQKYCHGATSAAIFGEIICQKLKEPIEQSVYKKTARILANEMITNCESLNGNRSNLEKHILKTLAEENDFDKYMNYIHNPEDHFKSFIRDEVSRYITDKFSLSVLPKMKENIKLLQQKIMKAAHESTEHVQVNNGNVGLWLKSFTQQLSDELIFSEKDLSGVKHDDVDDFSLLQNVIEKKLKGIVSEISSKFSTETCDGKLDFRPDELLIDHFCRCCWVKCPFCKAICTNTIENHDGDHSVPFHRVDGINGCYYHETDHLSVDFCTALLTSRKRFCVSNEWFSYSDYRSAGGVYAKWSITPDSCGLLYWKWFVWTFKKDLENYYNQKFMGLGEIPDGWGNHSVDDAVLSLESFDNITN